MPEKPFKLSKDSNKREFIIMPASGVHVTIYDISKAPLIPVSGYIYFYAKDKGRLLAFEVLLEESVHILLELPKAFKWYARHIGNPDMDILLKDPQAAA